MSPKKKLKKKKAGKQKLTSAQKATRRRRKRETMIIFINGRKKRVRREPTIDGMSVDEFIRGNADPIWLHQCEMWEYIDSQDIEFPIAPDVSEVWEWENEPDEEHPPADLFVPLRDSSG